MRPQTRILFPLLVRIAVLAKGEVPRSSGYQGRALGWFTISLALTLAAAAAAQTLDRGEIGGTIRDETGGVLPGATVTLRDTRTGFERTTVSSADGHYSGLFLPVGVYVVRARLSGFADAQSDPVPLPVGHALIVNLTMKVAPVTAAVTVTAEPANTSPALGTSIGETAIASLPITGRDYRDFALLSPTARSIIGTRGTFRVAGQPGDYLALNVDGADFTNSFFGEFFGSLETRNPTIPLEAVQEFHVSAGGLGPQSGRSTGGLVNVVTKSGTNVTRGSAAYVLRHHALAADDAFGNPPTGLVRHAGGGSLGGPLAANRTFYFVAADVQRQTTPLTVRFARDVSGVAVPELGIADLAAVQGQFPRRERVTTALAKVDHLLTTDQRLSVRVNFTRNQGSNVAGGSLILSRAVSNLESFHNQGVSAAASLSSSLGPRAFAESKVLVSGETRPRQPQGPGPQVQISDTGTLGGASSLPATQDMYRYQASETIGYVRGKHSLKAGADYNGFNMRNNAFALNLNGVYTFPTLEAFLRRQPSLYSQNFGLGGRTAAEAALLESFWQHEAAAYVQDQFRPTPRLTIDLGLRYDAQVNPQPQAGIAGVRVPVGPPVVANREVRLTYAPVPQGIPHATNQWGPRGAIAYDLTGEGSTLLRGSAGVYYGRTPMIYFPLRGSGTSNTTLFAPPSRFGVTFPNVLPSAIEAGSPLAALIGPPAIQYVDPGFRNPRAFQVSASITRPLVGGSSVEAGYLFTDSRRLRIGGFRSTLWDRNLAPPAQFDAFGRGVNVLAAGRPDRTITQANALASFGRGRYQALLVTLRTPPRTAWQFYASYTLAKSEGNGSTERDTEALLGPSDPFNLDADYGINELDERHQLKAYLAVMLPHDVSLAATWSAGSGLAFPVYSPVDVNGDGVTNNGLHPDRPAVDGRLLPRFPYHQPAYVTWDLRVAKGVGLARGGRAQVMLEVFNLLDAANTYADPRTQAILGRPNFRVNNQTLGPRLAQLGVRWEF
ncbi:MAG: TonB-dependent receptor [Acidobacteria bacterium]|nr:TonB-dependent receptor [Acidobacteriota bacterium]